MIKNKTHILYLVLGGFFITNALVAEFVGVKIFSLEKTLGISPFSFSFFGIDDLGFNMTAGVILWPFVFILTDIINEYFGRRGVQFLSYLTVGLILYAFLMIYGVIHLSPNTWWDEESGLSQSAALSIASMDLAYSKVLGQGLWIIVGSIVAFLVGQLLDVAVYQRIKRVTGEKLLWIRATGSTLVSQFIDSFVVLIVAFYIGADWELSRVLAIGLVNYLYKFIVAIGLTPIIYLAHSIIDNYLGTSLANELKTKATL